jgi:hypothetical protein
MSHGAGHYRRVTNRVWGIFSSLEHGIAEENNRRALLRAVHRFACRALSGSTGALSTEIERERDLSTPPSSFVPETDFPETTVVGVERAAREHAFFELDLHQIDCAVSIVFNAAGKREGRHVGAGRETTPGVVSSADSTRPSFSQEPVPEPSVSASASPRKVTHQSNGRDDA